MVSSVQLLHRALHNQKPKKSGYAFRSLPQKMDEEVTGKQ